jgi:aldehyde dehydrogenase (NAD+)
MSAIAIELHEALAKTLPQNTSFIDGKPLAISSGNIFDHINPATGRKQAEIGMAGAKEVDLAVAAAQRALPVWKATKPGKRAELLYRFAELVDKNMDRIAKISAIENGLSYNIVQTGHWPIVTGWMKYYAGFADKIEGAVTASYPSESFEYTIPEPFGVIGNIITWNAPMISLAFKVIPCLAAGCTTVVKPSEITPFTAHIFAELAAEAGIPDGVLNIIIGGPEAGEALVRHPGIAKISFTGGIQSAKRILAATADTLKPSLYELGGKSANLVFADCDLERTIGYSAYFPMACSGQGCQLPMRLLVEDSIYDIVVGGVIAAAQTIKVGDPLAADTYMGPVVNKAAADRISNCIDEAKLQNSGRLVFGGNRMGDGYSDGYFFEPTIFADVDPMSRIAQQEIFGPVLSILRFKDEAEAVALANNTPWGLAGYIQTKDLNRAHRVASQLVCGNVYINGCVNVHPAAPFGGVGISGFGKEGGRWGIEEFIRQKGVGIVIS